MKKQIIAVLLLVCIGTWNLLAQENDSVTTLPSISVASGMVVSKAVDKAFKKAFPQAKDLKWYDLNKLYMARFIENDMKHQAVFTQNGSMNYDISYGYEQHLPMEIRDRLKGGAYEDYKITHVTNIKELQRNSNIWIATLESLNHLVMVRVKDNELEEVEKYNKSK
jgi:hypothetical protein